MIVPATPTRKTALLALGYTVTVMIRSFHGL
ncbi:unnamed protein product, partial [Allacma fusca]